MLDAFCNSVVDTADGDLVNVAENSNAIHLHNSLLEADASGSFL